MCLTATSNLEAGAVAEIVSVPKRKFKSKGWGTRHTFAFLGFIGFLLGYALRINLSIAIVEMIAKNKDVQNSTIKVLGQHTISHQRPPMQKHKICPNPLRNASNNAYVDIGLPEFNSSSLLDQNTIDKPIVSLSSHETFNWSKKQEGIILGSFFWGYVVTQYPGGKLSHVYGPKWVFSLGILFTAILALMTPIITSSFDFYGLVALRFVQGLAEGVTLPSILVMLVHWAPQQERGRMTNWVYAGIPLGTSLTMISGGYLIHYFGWPYVFYVTGSVSVVWFFFWTFLVFNDPSEHPRITNEELKYIQAHLEGDEKYENIPTPWKSIFMSLPVWAIFIVDLGDSWSHYLLHVEVPIYLNSVHQYDIETNGWMSSLLGFLNFGVSILVAYVSDFIINKKYVSVLFVRKLCSTVALWGTALGYIGMVFGGCNTLVAVAALNFAAAIAGASNSGWTVNHIEIAPFHAGTISGLTNSVGNILGFLAPYVTGLILEYNPTLQGWQTALMIPALISFSVGLFYLAFASSEIQPWNRPKTEAQKNAKACNIENTVLN